MSLKLRLLRSDVRALQGIQIQQPIVLQGTMEGQRFLRKELPDALAFEEKKVLWKKP